MIYFFRHGETEWNLEHRYQGAKDSPLTIKGRNQVEIICNIFQEEQNLPNPLKVYVSPLGRALETASIFGEHFNIELIIDERLREISLGSWDGYTLEEIRKRYPYYLNGIDIYNWYFQSPDGESLKSAKQRIISWLSDVSVNTVCVVAHGLIGRVLMGVSLGLSDNEPILVKLST
jgi:probable phosphoglycerate mutase